MTEIIETDPYKLYKEDNLLNGSPVDLVVALYQGAIDAIAIAKECLANRDIPGRSKAINKTYNILTELLASLNHEKGREISKNLAGLYTYMQKRILEAHLKQKASPLEEVEKLLSNLLDGWKQASAKYDPFAMTETVAAVQQKQASQEEHSSVPPSFTYGNYAVDYGDLGARQAYSF